MYVALISAGFVYAILYVIGSISYGWNLLFIPDGETRISSDSPPTEPRPFLGYAIFTILAEDSRNSDESTAILQEHFDSDSQPRNDYIVQSIRQFALERSSGATEYVNLFDVLIDENKMITIQSLDNITQAIEYANAYPNVTHVLYDIEGWDQTPQAEKDRPADSISLASNEIRGHGLKYGITPDAEMLTQNYQEINWTQVDFLTMQLQRYSQNITEFRNVTETITNHVRENNDSIEIYVQLSFRFTDADQMIDAIDIVSPWVDGYMIAYLPEGSGCPTDCSPEALDKVLAHISLIDRSD